jgi:hypothetical protein
VEIRREIFQILHAFLNRPTVVFVSRTGKRIAARQKQGCKILIRRNIDVAVVNFARMVGFIAVAVTVNQKRSVPNGGNDDAIRRAVKFSRIVNRSDLLRRAGKLNREKDNKRYGKN